MKAILEAIVQERERQEAKWGRTSVMHRPTERGLTVLHEECGEVAEAILDEMPREAVRAELVQVAAVAVAMIQAIDAGVPILIPIMIPKGVTD